MNYQDAIRYVQNNPEQARQAQDHFQEMLQRSATDTDFRQKLLTDPRAAVAAFTGKEPPASFNVKFVENTADATIVLPDPVDAEIELHESELEQVAGGVVLTTWEWAALFGAIALVSAITNEIQDG